MSNLDDLKDSDIEERFLAITKANKTKIQNSH